MTGIRRAKSHIGYTEKNWKKAKKQNILYSLLPWEPVPNNYRYEIWTLRECYAAYGGNLSPSFRDSLSVPWRRYGITNLIRVTFQKSAYLIDLVAETWNHPNYEYLQKCKSNRNAKVRRRGWWYASPRHTLLSLGRTTDIRAKNFSNYTRFPYFYTDHIEAT